MKAGLIVGIDEVGRGPVAGPVCIGLVVMKRLDQKLLKGIKDSKKLSEKKREEWLRKIGGLKRDGKLDFTCAMISADVIDKKGIVFCINKAIQKCFSKIQRGSTLRNSCKLEVLLDGGLKAPKEFKRQKTIIKGDEKILIISAASVVAKVMRDRLMVRLAQKYPMYGFERHKGYGTKEHYKNIRKLGVNKIHRRTFLKTLKK